MAARPGLPRGQSQTFCMVSGFPSSFSGSGGTGFPACASGDAGSVGCRGRPPCLPIRASALALREMGAGVFLPTRKKTPVPVFPTPRGDTARQRRARRCRARTVRAATVPGRIGGTSMRKSELRAERVAWALARFLRRNQLPGEKEKNALAACQPRPAVAKRRRPNAFRALGKAFFSFSPALETHGAQERAKAHAAGFISAPTTGLSHTLGLSTWLLWFWWHRLSSLCFGRRAASPLQDWRMAPRWVAGAGTGARPYRVWRGGAGGLQGQAPVREGNSCTGWKACATRLAGPRA